MILSYSALNAMGFEVRERGDHLEITPTGEGDITRNVLQAIDSMDGGLVSTTLKDELMELVCDKVNQGLVTGAIMGESKWSRSEHNRNG